MKVLITGGAGFIGSHLCRFFLNKGFQVYCIDNLCTGSLDNIKSFKNHRDFTFINEDICEYISLPIDDLDYVFHYASPASPIHYKRLPIETLEAGSKGTTTALNIAKKYDSVFVLASTSEVYGDPLQNPQKETYYGNVNTIGIRSVYDESKRFSESITMAYNREYGVKTRIIRMFNTYGPNMGIDDGRVIPAFMTQTLKNEPLTIFGDGSQTRSFIYIDDQIEAIWKLAQSDYTQPVNSGNTEELTITEVANKIMKLTNSNSDVRYFPLTENDPLVRNPDISRIKEVLDWEPKISLDEGLKRTLSYFKQKIK